MRTIVVWALALVLVCPAVIARPNLAETPIYLRRRSNPLEIVEESVEASGSHQQPDETAGNGSTERVATDTTSAASPDSPSPASSSVGSTPASDQRPTHQPSFALKRPSGELLKTKIGTSGFVVSTSTKLLTGGTGGSGGPAPKQRPAEGEGKANDQLTLFDRYTGHVGVAEPLTDEEYQNELHRATERAPLRTTTTPREGLSTWVLLSGSDTTDAKDDSTSPSSSTRKASIAVTSTTTPGTTKRYQPTVRRGPLPTTTTQRPAKATTVAAEEKKESKPSKPLPKQKVAAAAATTTLKPVVIVKKAKKPLPMALGTTTTTTSPSTTTTPATTSAAPSTTETVLAEQSAPVTDAPSGDESVESSTFLILEPKDAMFDLPEDRSPAKVATMPKPKKGATRKPNTKPGTKKKGPGQKKTRKPEIKDGVAKPPTKSKPVSTQIINYLSREVMPTVGVGLVGLVMAAGLASYFLGSPLGALRRSDDRKDDLYYSNYEEYAGTQDGQNEEDVFGKLIAGMPDRSYYRNGGGNVRRRIATSQPVRTGHQYYHVQPYTGNKYPHISYRNRAYGGGTGPEMYSNINRQAGGGGSVVPVPAPAMPQAKSQNSVEFHYTPPTPYYPPSRAEMSTPAVRPPSAPVYSSPATTTTEAAAAAVPDHELASSDQLAEPAEHEMMPHPEAYSAEHSPEHHAHYVVGGTGPSGYSDAMLEMINAASMPEHGPRKKRSTTDESDLDNEINVDDDDDDTRAQEVTPAKDVVPETPHEEGEATTEEMMVVGDGPAGHRYTWGDFIRNTVERKVAMGISFLQHVTQDFQRYLSGVQDRFEGRQ